MSETWAFIASSHVTDSLEQRTEASGYPMYGIEFQVRDLDTGEILPVNETGALYVKGYTVTSGYWDKPEATARQHTHTSKAHARTNTTHNTKTEERQ